MVSDPQPRSPRRHRPRATYPATDYPTSGSRNALASPAARVTASAARYPLRTAPSIVAGHPDRVQSPARNRFANLVSAARPPSLQPRPRRERRPHFLHHVRLLQLRLPRPRERTPPVPSAPARSRPRAASPPARATHSPPVAPTGPRPLLNIHWMVRSSSVACGSSRDRAIEPQMDPRDGRMLEARQIESRVPGATRPTRSNGSARDVSNRRAVVLRRRNRPHRPRPRSRPARQACAVRNRRHSPYRFHASARYNSPSGTAGTPIS